MIIFLRSLLFNLCFYGFTTLISILGLPLLFARNGVMIIGRLWARGSLFLARMICGITYEIRGREHILSTPCIYASKHQSAWETLIFWIILPAPAFVLKRELLSLPLYGLYLKHMRNIAIDRQAGMEALKAMIAGAREVMSEGRSVIIFPEGTRMKAGVKGTYHPGVAALYSHLKVPVVPVALNSGLYWGRNAFVKRPGTISIVFLPPIAPGLKSRDFMATLEATIETTSNLLLKQ